MNYFRFTALLAVFGTLSPLLPASACDICGCYTPSPELNSQPLRPRAAGFFLASAEQYTFFDTTQFSGHEVSNTADQYEHSSVTQTIVGYNFNSRLGVQINAPLIEREYKRPEGFRTDRGTESGLGDISLIFNFVALQVSRNFSEAPADSAKDGKNPACGNAPFSLRPKEFTSSLNLIAGVKFPTGDASRFKEEFNEAEVEGATPSGIHGHDLALGSGSYDGVFGIGTFTRYKAGFFQASVQYTVRTMGLYHYRYANDLSFDFGPGVFFLQNKRVGFLGPATLGLQCVVSGEHKNRDTFRGEIADDTGATAFYVGPRLVGSIGSRLIAELGADLPVAIDNTAFQVVPTYRIRSGFSYRF